MGMDYDCGHEKFNPFRKIKSLISYKINFAREHPDYFHSDGLLVFCGPQGSGKTLSSVNYVCNLMDKYPKCKLVTNLMIYDYPVVTFEEYLVYEYGFDYAKLMNVLNNNSEFDLETLKSEYKANNRVFPFNNSDDLSEYENGELGVIYFIDEIQLYFNSLESKNINMEVMVQISQQRKQRKHIVCTSQVFGRMAKQLREQFSVVCVCDCYMGMFQSNKVVSRDSITQNDDQHVEGIVKRKYFYIHSPFYYRRYDTYYTIDRNKFISNEKKVGDIYESRLSKID